MHTVQCTTYNIQCTLYCIHYVVFLYIMYVVQLVITQYGNQRKKVSDELPTIQLINVERNPSVYRVMTLYMQMEISIAVG